MQQSHLPFEITKEWHLVRVCAYILRNRTNAVWSPVYNTWPLGLRNTHKLLFRQLRFPLGPILIQNSVSGEKTGCLPTAVRTEYKKTKTKKTKKKKERKLSFVVRNQWDKKTENVTVSWEISGTRKQKTLQCREKSVGQESKKAMAARWRALLHRWVSRGNGVHREYS